MQKYLIVFDLDNTLADLGEPIDSEALQLIKKLCAKGHIVAIASGKPVYYLVGLCRQADLSDIWLIGENGAQTIFGTDLPPKRYFSAQVNEISILALENLKQELISRFGNKVWFQPNEIALTIFFDSEHTQSEIRKFLDERQEKLSASDVEIFPHNDSFDLSPSGIDKGKAVTTLMKDLKIDPSRTVAVGDSWNDLPMFLVCHRAIAINFPDVRQSITNFEKSSSNLRELFQDSRTLSHDSAEVSRDSRKISHDSAEVSRDSRKISYDSAEVCQSSQRAIRVTNINEALAELQKIIQ